MITVKLLGGLGNQMFQLAFAKALEAYGRVTQLDRSSLVEGTHREYSLWYFGDYFFGRPEGSFISETSLRFNEDMLQPPDPSTLCGYWQSEKYFESVKNAVRQEFTPESPMRSQVEGLIDEIRHTNSVFVHVRRKDYVNLQHFHGMPTLAYYEEGLRRIEYVYPNTNVFIFSDDPEWCSQNFNHRVVEGTTKYEDLRLMSACRHGVLANSSFSWWAAWLGDTQEDRMVVAPARWFADPTVDDTDIVPNRWIKI
jgi:hypothetical protein